MTLAAEISLNFIDCEKTAKEKPPEVVCHPQRQDLDIIFQVFVENRLKRLFFYILNNS